MHSTGKNKSDKNSTEKIKLVYVGKNYFVPKKSIENVPYFNNKMRPIQSMYIFDNNILELSTKHVAFTRFVDFLKKRNEYFFLCYNVIESLDVLYDLVMLINYVSLFDIDAEDGANICLSYLCLRTFKHVKNHLNLYHPKQIKKIYTTIPKISFISQKLAENENVTRGKTDNCIRKKFIKELQPFPTMYNNLVNMEMHRDKMQHVFSYYLGLDCNKSKKKSFDLIIKLSRNTCILDWMYVMYMIQICQRLFEDNILYEACPKEIKQIIREMMFNVDSYYTALDNNDERADILRKH